MFNYPPYSLFNFLGINLWVSNKKNLPLKFVELYTSSICISILPINDYMLNNSINLKKIKSLYYKMLTVLNLQIGHLSKVEIYYDFKKILSDNDKQLLTKKLLIYHPKMIIIFGDLEFLDINLLKLHNIDINYIIHPNNLLDNTDNKTIAYNSLLRCKQQLHKY